MAGENKQISEPHLLGWALAETLSGTGELVVIADQDKIKSHGTLHRTRIAQSRRASDILPTVIHECIRTRKRQYRQLPGASPLAIHIVPALGPSGVVYAVQLWTGTLTQRPPLRTAVGTIEWDVATGIGQLNSALERQLAIPPHLSRSHRTLPDLLSYFDGFDDFLGFLDLFDRHSAVDRWVGTVTTPGQLSVLRRHLRIVARVHTESGKRRVRAVVHDITSLQPPPSPHLDSVTLAGYPSSPTHAIARIDLGTCLINRWIALSPGALAAWAHQSPEIDGRGIADIARCCAEMKRGAMTAVAELRIRFLDADTWLTVHAEWIRLHGARRPQAIIDLTTDPRP